MQLKRSHALTAAFAFAPLLAAADRCPGGNRREPAPSPQCMANTAFFNPDTCRQDIDLPPGFTASVFAVGSEHADRHRLSRQREQLPGVRSRIRARPAERVQRRNVVAGWRVRCQQPVHTGHPGIQPKRHEDPRPVGQTDIHRRRVPASGPAIDIAFVQRPLRRAALRDRFQPIDPSAQRATTTARASSP